MSVFTGNLTWLIYLTTFLAIFLFCMGVSQVIRQRAARREFVEKIQGGTENLTRVHEKPGGDSKKFSMTALIVDVIGRIGNLASPKRAIDYSDAGVKFLRAGIRHENAETVFWGVKLFLLVSFFSIFIICRVAFFKLMNQPMTISLGVLSGLLGFYLPNIWLRQKGDKRKDKILKALPDALDLLVVCVESGMGLDSAFNRVAQELKFSSPELSDELNFMTLELRAGKLRQAALKDLALRTNLEEISSLVALLIQTDKFGTSMADALRVYSDTFRTQRYQRAEERAAKIPVKLVIPLVLFIFPSLFVVLLGPAMISIYKTLIGRF
jgi:tight adherence protein C